MTRDPAADLRDAVHQLAYPHDIPIIQLGQHLGHRTERPLLHLLADATTPTITTNGRNTTPGPRLAFDPTASNLLTTIHRQIRTWAATAQVPRHWAAGHPVDWQNPAALLTAWHARTLTHPSLHLDTLTDWTHQIRTLITDPPLRTTINAPCPDCHQRWALTDGVRIDALQVTFHDPTITTTCRNCGTEHEGVTGAEHVMTRIAAAS